MGYILVIPSLFIICFFIGSLLCYKLSITFSIIRSVGLGMFFCFALFQVMAIPFMVMKWRFSWLLWLYLLIIGILFILALVCFPRIKVKWALKDWRQPPKQYPVILITMLLVLLQMLVYVFFKHGDHDDSFYIAIVNTVLDSNTVFGLDPSLGLGVFPYPKAYLMVGYELFLAVLSKVFRIHPAILCHTLIPLFYIPLSYLLFFEIAKELFPKRKWEFLLLICLLNLFGGYSVYSTASFLLLRIWQGKAALANLVMPSILLIFIKLFKDEELDKKKLVIFSILLLSGTFFSSIGVYLPVLAYGLFVLAYLIFNNKNRLKNMFKFAVPILCILPIAVVTLIFVHIHPNDWSVSISDGAAHLDYIQVWKNASGESHIFLLLILMCLFIMVLGNGLLKRIFLFMPFLLMATFLNPLLKNLVAVRITGVPVYWRLLWVIPTYISIATGIVLLLSKVKRKWVGVALYAVAIVVIMANGVFMYREGNFDTRDNWHKINQDVIDVADHILNTQNNAVLMAETDFSAEVRTYTASIALHWSRANYYNLLGMQKEYDQLNLLYEGLFGEQNRDVAAMLEAMRDLGIDFVVLNNDKQNVLASEGYMKEELILRNYTLYRMIR